LELWINLWFVFMNMDHRQFHSINWMWGFNKHGKETLKNPFYEFLILRSSLKSITRNSKFSDAASFDIAKTNRSISGKIGSKTSLRFRPF
jgi:hypothetical protein